jgi:diguanylate cyclase (GGDEF)-like protein
MFVREWSVGILAAIVIAAAVLGASEQQRSTAETNFQEAQAAGQMQVAMLGQERALDGFLASGQLPLLANLYRDQLQLDRSLADARKLAADDRIESRAVLAQAVDFRRWTTLATGAITRREATGDDDSVVHERQRGAVIDAFLAANADYQDRLLVNRYREERSAALLPVWVLLALAALFGSAALFVARRKRHVRLRHDAFAVTQARFVEAVQFAESESEGDELLGNHIEEAIPGAKVVVLRRDLALERYVPARPLSDDHPLAASLADSETRSCLAVRLSRRYDRGSGSTPEVLRCPICGVLDTPSTCQPLLVGGEVIGAVLVAHGGPLGEDAQVCLRDTGARAAPVLANLRNLAIAESRAATDALTGLPNRRSVDEALVRMLALAGRTKTRLSVGMLDIDHFKEINDNYGHDRGDDVLAALGGLLRAQGRASDFCGRYGGEEFVFVLPDTGRTEAVNVAEKIRTSIHKLQIAGVERPITASIGIATYPDDAGSMDTLMRAADSALYTAKNAGRDRTHTPAPTDLEADVSITPASVTASTPAIKTNR